MRNAKRQQNTNKELTVKALLGDVFGLNRTEEQKARSRKDIPWQWALWGALVFFCVGFLVPTESLWIILLALGIAVIVYMARSSESVEPQVFLLTDERTSEQKASYERRAAKARPRRQPKAAKPVETEKAAEATATTEATEVAAKPARKPRKPRVTKPAAAVEKAPVENNDETPKEPPAVVAEEAATAPAKKAPNPARARRPRSSGAKPAGTSTRRPRKPKAQAALTSTAPSSDKPVEPSA